MADGVRESIVTEAARVEEENGADGEEDVAGAIATLSVTVRVVHLKVTSIFLVENPQNTACRFAKY